MRSSWENNFIRLLRQYVIESTQTEVARRIGVSRPALQRILLGEQSIKVEQVETALRRLRLCPCRVTGQATCQCTPRERL